MTTQNSGINIDKIVT